MLYLLLQIICSIRTNTYYLNALIACPLKSITPPHPAILAIDLSSNRKELIF
jgi:hypothetical protein